MTEIARLRGEVEAGQGVLFGEVGLTLPEDLGFEDWQDLGVTLGRIARAALWWWGDWLQFGERRYGEMYSQALDQSDYAYDSLRAAAWVSSRIETVRRRTVLSWSHHREVAALEPDDQDRYLDQAVELGWTHKELRKAVRRRSLSPPADPPELPAGTFDVLLADPPWQYDFAETDSRAVENQYSTMTTEDIAALEVPAADDAILYLWTTTPKLREAFDVIDGWGFEYVTNMVWVKDRIGMGYHARGRHEHLLIAKRGDWSPPDEGNRPDSVIEAPKGKHSVKPEIVYDLIETAYPDRTYLELFARSGRDGWQSWGNQL